MFHKCFDLVFGYFKFFQVFNWLFVDSSSKICYHGDEGVDLPSGCSKCLYEWVVFGGFSLCIVFGHLSWHYVYLMDCMTFDKVGAPGDWLSMGAPRRYIWSKSG